MEGLLGSRGILPAAELLRAARGQLGPAAYRLLPTLFWLGAGDAALRWACLAGAGAALLALAGALPGPALLACWALYLSFVAVGRDFMAFQWDSLLLEAGFLSLLLAPWGVRPGLATRRPPPAAALWLLRWLLFRLMFQSGCVKLLSGDAAWRSLTALSHHYETQPLPAWTSWYAHRLPAGFHALSAACMFVVELGAPFLVLLPRRARQLAFFPFVLLQALIAATGNYCFFNLLTAALCVLLLDDAFLLRLIPRLAAVPGMPTGAWRSDDDAPPQYKRRMGQRLLTPLATLLFLGGVLQLAGMFRGRLALPGPLGRAWSLAAPLCLVNSYGLFAVMTTVRPEIMIEGSLDGVSWRPYEFRWKPGDPGRRPRFVAPHQPRLDWQMWFAALSDYRSQPWFPPFLARLLQGSPPVLALLQADPFPGAPPRYLRVLLFEYRFSGPQERRQGLWWRRELKGLYCPVVSLRGSP